MELAISNTHQASGLSKLCDFKIESNGVMIKALTSRLYSDPISSIVRELASNALDACPQHPMDIKLPSVLTPHFSITDYGPGLSPTDLVEVFTRFGASTKRNTNTQIGGFGLGAKSPFALVNSFTIISRHAGTESTYIASIGNDGMPGLHCVSSTPTNESGVTITVPSSINHDKWRQALTQLEFFQPRPIVNGTPMPDPDILFTDTDFMVLRKGDPAVMVGPVRYPLSLGRIAHSAYSPPVVLQFPIGSIEVTASREEIVYSTATCEALRIKMTKAVAAYIDHLKLIYDKCKSLPELWRVMDADILNRDYNYAVTHPDGTSLNVVVRKHSALPDNNRFSSYNPNSRRKRWSFNPSLSDIYKSGVYFLMDDMRQWQPRIVAYLNKQQAYSAANVHCVSKASADILDAVGVPYIKLSSLPYNGPSRNSPRPVKFRTLSANDKLIPADYQAEYMIHVDSDMRVINSVEPSMQPKLTRDLLSDISRVAGNCYVIPPNFKGNCAHLQDVLPSLYSKIREDLRLNFEVNSRSARIMEAIGATQSEIYHELGLLPSTRSLDSVLKHTSTKFVTSLIPAYELLKYKGNSHNWELELKRIFGVFPALSVAHPYMLNRSQMYLWIKLLTPYVQERLAETSFIPQT